MSAIVEGEVAIITFPTFVAEHGTGRDIEHLAVKVDKGWDVCTPGYGNVPESEVKSVRRVLIVDPLGRDDTVRYITSIRLLRTALDQTLEGSVPYNLIEDAVRALVTSIPDEPLGVAAAVTDIDSCTWVRTKPGNHIGASRWVPAVVPTDKARSWDQLVVEVVHFDGIVADA